MTTAPPVAAIGRMSRRAVMVASIAFANVAVPLIVVGFLTADAILPIIAIGGVLLIIATLMAPTLGILALVVMLPFNGLISQLLGPGLAATGFGALKDVILVLLIVAALRHGRWKRIRVDIAVLVGIILTLSLISGLWAEGLQQGAYGWRNDFEPLLLLLCVPVLLDETSIRRITTTMVVVVQVSAAVSVATWSLGLPWLRMIGRLPVPPGEDFPSSLFTAGNNWPRAFSPYVAPNEMAVAVVLIVAVIWSRRDWGIRTRILLSVLPAAAIILSSSRSGQIGLALLAIALITRWLYNRRPAFAIGFLGASALGGLTVVALYIARQLATRIDPSLLGHASSIQDAIPTMLGHPLGVGLGSVGPRAYRYLETPYHVESFWLLIALESGILAMLAFVALLVRICIIGIRANTSMAFLAPAAVFGSLVSQLVLPTLQEGAVSFTLWIVVSLGLATAAQGKSHTTRGDTHIDYGTVEGESPAKSSSANAV